MLHWWSYVEKTVIEQESEINLAYIHMVVDKFRVHLELILQDLMGLNLQISGQVSNLDRQVFCDENLIQIVHI